MPPALCLVRPKYLYNVGNVLRACACFQVNQLYIIGDRPLLDGKKERVPRELRYRDYKSVEITYVKDFEEIPHSLRTPVCVEYVQGYQPLQWFDHPEHALYVFGPEDGDIPQNIRKMCHQFVYISTKFCLNLSSCANIILYDRFSKGVLLDRQVQLQA